MTEKFTDKQLKEIKASVDSYVKTYGIEGAEGYILSMHENHPELIETMLFLLRDKYNIKTKNSLSLTPEQNEEFDSIKEVWDKREWGEY